MKQRDDWDAEEHDAIAGLDDQLEIMRGRQAADPPLELMQAARAGHTLEQSFNDLTSRRIWATIQHRLGQASPRRSSWRWAAAALATAATIAVAVTVNRPAQTPVVTSQPSAVTPPPAPVRIEFTKPDVKLSPAVLSWRGNGAESAYVRDLRPAIEAYRSGNYADAETLFATIASSYPTAIEGVFYLGIVRMLRNDFAGAVAPLAAAAAMAEPAFADDAAWFLGVAEQRSGRTDEAMRRLGELCKAGGPRANDACGAIQLMTRSR